MDEKPRSNPDQEREEAYFMISPLKSDWKTVKFGDVVKNANLTERDPAAAGIERIVGLEHLDPENLHVRRWNTLENGTSFSRKFVSGQTLFGKRRAYQRKVAFAEFEGICSGDILTFEPKDPDVLLPELLPFICQTDAFFDHALGTSAGSLSPRTSYKALQDFEFPLPPIEEQKRIVEILWAADEAVERWGSCLSRIDKLSGVLSTHFKDVDSTNMIALGKMVALGEASIINGPFGTILKASSYQPEGTPLVNPTHIRDGNLDIDGSPKLGATDTARLERYRTKVNDILVGRKGDMDKVLLVDESTSGVITGTDCLRVRLLNAPISAEYLYYWLSSPYIFNWLSRYAHGTTMPGINEKTLHRLEVPLVSLDQQTHLVSITRQTTERINETERHLKKVRAMMQSLNEMYIGGSRVGLFHV